MFCICVLNASKVIFVTFNLNCKFNAVSVRKPSVRILNFRCFSYFNTESKQIFSFLHTTNKNNYESSCYLLYQHHQNQELLRRRLTTLSSYQPPRYTSNTTHFDWQTARFLTKKHSENSNLYQRLHFILQVKQLHKTKSGSSLKSSALQCWHLLSDSKAMLFNMFPHRQ